MKIFKLLIIFGIIITIFYPFHGADPIQYVNRETKEVRIEKVPGEFWLSWLYNNPLGELSLELLVKRKIVSEWYGNKMDSPESVGKIDDFVKEYNIDLSEAQKDKFSSFNDFFYRKLKTNARKIDTNYNSIVSPADGKVLVYKNIDNQDFIVKGYRFSLTKFLSNDKLANKYRGGSFLIVRLCPTDYHRYHFPLSGKIINENEIDGDYYSVSPIALKKKIEILCMNKRSYVEVHNDKIGEYLIVEVGATMVGSIIHSFSGKDIKKGEEMGYFKFGGSTIVLLFEKNKIKIDKDLINNTINGFETEIKMGENVAFFAI